MRNGLEHLQDCRGVHYRLQLNAYKYIIEKYYGRRVSAMKVVCTHPDNGYTPFVDEVPFMPEETEVLMRHQRWKAGRANLELMWAPGVGVIHQEWELAAEQMAAYAATSSQSEADPAISPTVFVAQPVVNS